MDCEGPAEGRSAGEGPAEGRSAGEAQAKQAGLWAQSESTGVYADIEHRFSDESY